MFRRLRSPLAPALAALALTTMLVACGGDDDAEMATFVGMVKAAAYDRDPAAFRAVVERAGLLRRGAPVTTEEAGAYFSHFYEAVREDRPMTRTKEYASGIVRHTFDRTSPIAQYATVPRPFVFIQRINLGLYALLGDLGATGNYRRLAEELWPFAQRGRGRLAESSRRLTT